MYLYVSLNIFIHCLIKRIGHISGDFWNTRIFLIVFMELFIPPTHMSPLFCVFKWSYSHLTSWRVSVLSINHGVQILFLEVCNIPLAKRLEVLMELKSHHWKPKIKSDSIRCLILGVLRSHLLHFYCSLPSVFSPMWKREVWFIYPLHTKI